AKRRRSWIVVPRLPEATPDGAAGGREVVQPHLGVLAREHHPVGPRLQGRGHGGVGVVGARLAAPRAGRDADVDPGEDPAPPHPGGGPAGPPGGGGGATAGARGGPAPRPPARGGGGGC